MVSSGTAEGNDDDLRPGTDAEGEGPADACGHVEPPAPGTPRTTRGTSSGRGRNARYGTAWRGYGRKGSAEYPSAAGPPVANGSGRGSGES